MSDIKLSICIPTYNRAIYLRHALEHCENLNLDFPYEIVISDNASTDDTTKVVSEFQARGLPIQYYRRAVNGGSGPNLTCAFRQAVGEFLIYLADDDLLVPQNLKVAMQYLEANTDVVACYAPWTIYDEIEDRDVFQFYRVAENTKFPQRSFSDLFDFLFKGHVFPEIGIYRASALRSAWVPRDFCFWAFSYLAHFLDQGSVAFLQEPFYRSVSISKVKSDRKQAGHDDVMTAWDKYRGGLEYFLYVGRRRGQISTAPEVRILHDEMCKIFTLNRMVIAMRFWAGRKDFIKAYELYTRLALGGLAEHPEVVELTQNLTLFVSAQTLVYHVNSVAGIERLIVNGVEAPEPLEDLLRNLGLSPQIEVVTDTEPLGSISAETTAVFAADAAAREKFLQLGFKSNLILMEEELTRHILL